ncbi:MAG: T9SS type A sorting domain-containing protein [Spirosoma sp.]|nr:T9SS type A sorting domain-containing protein [Spirosoma sp.]
MTNFTDGGNNLTTCVSPFVSPTDARLNGCSPAINTGDNAANATATDLAGNARVFPNGGRIDMGAYEYQGTPGQTPTVAIPGVSTATVGVAFSQNFTAAGGSGPYSYSVASGSLPTGLGLATTGVLSGTPTQSGSFTITVLGRDATGCSGVSAAYVLTVINATPTITGFAANPAALCVGSPVTFMATIGNLMGSYSYTLTNGSLTQTGNSTSTTFSQSVTASGSGTQTFTLTASVNGQSAASVTALTVNPLPPAPTLTGVSRTVNANNTPLPLGQFVSAPGTLSFSGVSGAIANPPTANISTGGVQNFQVTQTDANGCISGATPFSITVLPPTPGNQTVCRSSLVVLTALTTGVRYEWYKNGQSTPFKLTEIASIQRGTATSSLTLVSVQTTASYYCKVFQANGSFTFDGPLKVTVDYSCIAPGARLGAHAVAATEGAEVPLSITLTPNPVVDGQLKAVVRGVAGAALSVDLLDLNGQVVRSQHWASAAGEQVIEWNIAAQPAGQYLLQAQAAGQRSTAKVIHR